MYEYFREDFMGGTQDLMKRLKDRTKLCADKNIFNTR